MSRAQTGISMVLAVAAIMVAAGPSARADDYRQGESYVEKRGGVYGTSGDNATRLSSQGGAAGVYVANGLALEAEGLGYTTDPAAASTPDGRPVGQSGETDAMGTSLRTKWHVVRGKKGSLHLGAGAGILSGDESGLGKSSISQTNSADLGMSLNMSKSVSLKAQARYQNIGGIGSSGTTEAMGGNVGLKISF
ncbi:hypothetical protein G3N56_13985 [Desulfovibrio sulfodismutans]|uniref:Porin family protein n=1 Tax=Desulfolutivibrio sulfodismutans TaxID=63561 RepID=A0A7K3NNS1_9BACT|nr:hypothetical protein [Desulfolutivibrio sulfodismutans]NDY57842.1 hypothetical protein [Desulfolutivibrio sulfodismutans]QLA10988.1 hypothetical protein GD606_01185 [Desulfolutivibrio sulfodismutans DSM 3696]